MQTQQRRAAILLHTGSIDQVKIKTQQEACQRYCQQQEYQLSEQNIYRDEGQLLCSDLPQLVHLRMLVVQGELDVLVIPWAECLGPLPLWGSPSTAQIIDEFYKYAVRIESVITRHGAHDIYQQMLLDAIHFVEQIRAAQIKHHTLFEEGSQDEKPS